MNHFHSSRDGTSSVQPDDDEISLYKGWLILRDGWRWLLLGLLVGFLGAAAYLAVTPPQYEVTASIKIGQVGQVGQVVESLADAIRRLRLVSFQDAVLKSIGWSNDGKDRLYRTSFQATEDNGLIVLKLRAWSPHDARTAGEATVAQLATQHRYLPLARIAIEKTRTDAANLSTDIREVEFLLSRLHRLDKTIPASNIREQLTLISMTENYRIRLRAMRKEEEKLKEWLASQPITATATIEPPSVSDVPVFPKMRQTLLFAGFGGFLLGLLAVMLRCWRRDELPPEMKGRDVQDTEAGIHGRVQG